jgi:flagellar FliL protein
MSEAKEAPAKKGGKLPIIIALVAMLGAGGFFGMKMKGGEKKEPEVKLGKIETLAEFLVNLRGNDTYLKAEVALHFADTFQKKTLDDNLPAVRDAVLVQLTSRSLSEISSPKGKERLRRSIAFAVNGVFAKLDNKGEDKKKDEKADSMKPAAAAANPPEPENPDWDSDKGPVLKVYFPSFVTQ